MFIDRVFFTTGAATGGAGVATATGYSNAVSGYIEAVYIKYLGSPPAGTTDFTLTELDDPAAEPIITLVNAATDVKIYPRRQLEQNDGTGLLYASTGEGVYGRFAVFGKLKAVIAGANDADYCDVTVWVLRR